MNFKQWLISEEEEKDINLSNPKLTSTITPLNTSVSNPNLTTTKISNREIASNQKVKALAIKYKELGGKYPREFKNFLNDKRKAYKDYKKADGTKNSKTVWYPSDIKIARDNGLPDNWMLFVDLEKESNKKVEELAIKYTELGGKYPREFKTFLNSKRKAYQDLIDGTKTTSYVWYPSDIQIAKDYGLPNNWMLFVDLEKESNKQVEALGKRYQELGGKYPPEFKNFLNSKRKAYQDLIDGTKNSKTVWYPSDIEVAEKNGLPEGWMLRDDLEKESNKQVEALGKRYQELGGKYPREFGAFLNDKRRAYQDYKKVDGTKTTTSIWYPSDIQIAKDNGLPNNWMDPQMEILKSRNEQKSNDRLEELAIYYGRNGSGPSKYESDKKNKSLAGWLINKKKKSKPNPHEASDDKTWAEIVSKFPNWIDPVTKKPFKYTNLPIDWREVKPAGKKSLGEELVLNILKKLGITNIREYRDEACFNKRCLPFDFSITHNGKKYLLEYHGEQHYIPAYFGSGEGMKKQEIANNKLKEFNRDKENDTIKYNHCVKGKIPLLVIPYWLYKNPDFIENRIIEFLKTNEFNETFANPVVPQNYKAYHDRILKITECFASGKLDCKELFKKQKTTFEQFLINKNFINK